MLYDFYKNKKVVVTGATGIKGSYLSLWLHKMGAKVTGISLDPPSKPNHFDLLGLHDIINDVRHNLTEQISLQLFNPEIVFHLAADAIVSKTFEHPRDTFHNNVMSAVNILDACSKCPSVKSVVIITSDKVYFPQEWNWGYRENDKLGDNTPYGASKVCVEQVINCYREHFIPCVATARAGNIMAGGDFGLNRLIPDIARATAEKRPVIIHTPSSTRPWQYVLEALNGYMLLAKAVYENPSKFSKAYNFGPTSGEMTVLEILLTAKEVWSDIDWEIDMTPTHPAMVYLLKIDSEEARKDLNWRPHWNMRYAVKKAIEWYRAYYQEGQINTEWDIEEWSDEI